MWSKHKFFLFLGKSEIMEYEKGKKIDFGSFIFYVLVVKMETRKTFRFSNF